MLDRAYYSDSIAGFLRASSESILGTLARRSEFAVETTQRDAWVRQIDILKTTLRPLGANGAIYFELIIPRLGKRIDVVLVTGSVIFVLEFKVGEREFTSHALDQVSDYALDLKHFHDTSHAEWVAPVLVATDASQVPSAIATTTHDDRLLVPIRSTPTDLGDVIRRALDFAGNGDIDVQTWAGGRYCPTPTIVEAATALYGGHSVAEISRSDASAVNLTLTSDAVTSVLEESRTRARKSICFVTGVPGAGKTLVGLNIANQHIDKDEDLYSVFLSGNGPLVEVLREALARDSVRRGAEAGERVTKTRAMSEVKMFIQNVHHFRDECLVDMDRPPIEHVALFDEAQRAWTQPQTAKFMRQKKGRASFTMSEPAFLISCLDRHPDWATIVCLVGGGQEINTGEAGITEWIESLERSFPHWHVYISSRLTDSEYGAGHIIERVRHRSNVTFRDELHLGVSMRSFRAERVSLLVKQLLDLEEHEASRTLAQVIEQYPIVVTRNLSKAKAWLRAQARGTERYGIVVSSQAERLKPHAIDVKSPMKPTHWFLNGKDDVRSSYFLEAVATEFHVQGLELDWACVTWDADFRFTDGGWEHWSFHGNRWKSIRKSERKAYLKNAYRVLLTRARQGMAIVVPEGNDEDGTREREFYDPTFEYLRRIGLPEL